ncbi:PREDICTED: LEAF RUST 10 DISEASE-RESISTANCE LOCUS RECEPTOR-LIKE PROTEIN KINASE-like 2.1 [Lupinus angustifolius]|nr:PREDICTED: LEAF RUST 10 DISEASE-RESISTANCE LOCUS RECEPTOR-LIKE PROTEIN KINASE-like 2.1 [Lupinus angustifolius]
MMFKLACFFSFLFILFTNSSSSNSTSSSITCPTYHCTNGPNITYPFWLSQGTPPDQYCGYPEFGLICSDHGYPIFSPPPGLYYYLKDIDYISHNIKLVDADTANQTCARAVHSVPIGNLPLSHSHLNLNLSFYFNCSDYPYGEPVVKCLSSGVNESFVFVLGDEPPGFDWSKSCEENVVVPVLRDEVTRDNNLVNEFSGAMNEGFVLNWHTSTSCVDCEASDGLCGYNNNRTELLCFCKDGSVRSNKCEGGSSTSLSRLSIGLISGGIGALLIICITIFSFRHKLSPIVPEILKPKKVDQDIEAFIRNNGPLAIKRYSYSDIKKMTNSFESKLGQGGYGQVYKGNLNKNVPVAVKVLNASKGKGEEFINEVMSISRTSHVNVVNLLGFCVDSHKNALIYEFMPNGSLEKFINNKDFETNPPLSWERLHQIAEGIAKGLEYLHRGCNTRILHFDIKPSNILLDKNFNPKISDFGLAKLCSKTQSIISMLDARGTIGYIAPEVWNKNFGGVSHKSDVYSYGMLILEMVGGKQNKSTETTHSSETYFPHWIYKHIDVGSNAAWYDYDLTIEENEIVKKMIMVGLWCIQTNPYERPPMSRVIEMLEGRIEQLQIPPKPFIYSPTRPSCTTSNSYD